MKKAGLGVIVFLATTALAGVTAMGAFQSKLTDRTPTEDRDGETEQPGARAARGRPIVTDDQGDPLPERALFQIGTTWLWHRGGSHGVTVSEDGKLLASWGGSVRVWDSKDGRPLWNFDLSHYGPWALAFSRDGKELAAISRSPPGQIENGDFRRWSLATGREREPDKKFSAAFDGTVVNVALACTPDGQYVVAETARADISLYEPGVPASGKTLKGHAGRVMDVGFTRDAKTLVSLGDDGTIRCWNVGDGREIGKVPALTMKKHELAGNIAAIAAAPQGKTLAVSLPDGTTRIVDAAGRELRRLPPSEQLPGLAFSPSGKSLFSAGKLVQSWDVDSGKEIPILRHPHEPIRALTSSPDGAIAAFADDGNHVQWVNIAKRTTRLFVQLPSRGGVAFSPDGKYFAVASGDDENILLWDSAQVLAGDKPTLARESARLHCVGKVKAFVFAPDGKRLAMAANGGGVHVYEVASKRLLVTIKSADRPVTFSPDGKRVATLGDSGIVRGVHLWDSATGKEVFAWDSSTVKEVAGGRKMPNVDDPRWTAHSVAFHPNGKAIAALHYPEAAKEHRLVGMKDVGPPEDRFETIRLWDLAFTRERMMA